ncbi:hypothetical protein AMTR_s02257p00008130 [Amborella trichopoda]|uniref:Uncharacterized protein n=1 Tax=Amborella trichopoda TaxID=13333 RepID=U5D0R2_AMBTC|nr:hypothetical protein AMTR_s02257p00008130 [Amborella trichopoda]
MTETSSIQPQSKQLKMRSESAKGQSKTSSYHPSKVRTFPISDARGQNVFEGLSHSQGTINAMPPADRKEGSIT